MAETDEGGVDYYAVLNVRKEANKNELRAASRCMCIITRTSIKIPRKRNFAPIKSQKEKDGSKRFGGLHFFVR
ncbi:DnaJ (Hsp40) [Porites harrisoni]